MLALVVILVVVALIAVAAAAWFFMQQRRTTTLRERFGPEYERALSDSGDRGRAERELQARQERVEKLHIRPLSAEDEAGFASAWHSTQARFVDDPPGAMGTVAPLAVTFSTDTVAFTTQTAGDPCDTFVWRISAHDASGAPFPPRDVQAAPDRDGDGVADGRDNCPDVYNPDQADRNGNRKGDACEPDTTAPVIGKLVARPGSLWPPNHKMVPVSVEVAASDDSGIAPVCRLTAVSSNEPVLGTGDGRTSPDWQITGALTVNLRAERSGNGDGRVYTLAIECQDRAGNTATGHVAVGVPHDQRDR